MNSELLREFLQWECTPYVSKLLRSAVDAARASSGPPIKRFEFNRFEVTLNLEGDTVVLEDVQDPSELGMQTVSIEEFLAALAKLQG